MLVDKTNFVLVLYNYANFNRYEKHLLIGQLNEYQFVSAFHWSASDTPAASQYITAQLPISKTLCGPCIAAIAGSFLYGNTGGGKWQICSP